MPDIYVPGVTSRFNTEKLIDDLMKVERVPKDRAEQNISRLETNKSNWQDIGRRLTTLRESARLLYSFQNPFNDRIVHSSDEGAISGAATREAVEQERTFTIKQVAQADRFLSSPLDDSYRVEEGNYRFTVGKDEISFDFRGGSLKDFIEVLNRRGKDKIQASLVSVKQGSKSLLIESKITGEDQKLGFSGDAETLAIQSGMMERGGESRREISLNASTVKELGGSPGQSFLSFDENTLTVGAEGAASVAIAPGLRSTPTLMLKFETATRVLEPTAPESQSPPPGPEIPPAGSISYGGVTIENDPSVMPIPSRETPSAPVRIDARGVISLTFSDGSKANVPPLEDSFSFTASQYRLDDIAHGKTIVSVDFINRNTHRDVSIRNVEIYDPDARSGLKPANAVSNAQDAIITMEGIEIRRPSNTIDDLIPGVTLTARSPSASPIRLGVEPDREGVKDAIISLVGNYNRIMAEINVLTRNDDKLIQELTYLTTDEQDAMKKKLGAFSGDSSLSQVKNSLQRAATSPYPTSLDGDQLILAQIGVSTDARRSGSSGYDPARLRGYLEIDEKALDTALQTQLPAIARLFGSDTDGDLIVDSGLAYAIENLSKPYVESGGIIAMKTGTVDSQITQEERKIETLDRQLAAKEAALKSQYGQMEGAYNRMESMSTSLDQFSSQNSGSGGR